MTRVTRLLWSLVGSALAACGPESALDALADNVRIVCSLERGICYGGELVEEAVDRCVKAQAEKGRERASAMGDACLELYAEFFACAANWTCQDIFTYIEDLNDPEAPCQDLRGELNTYCPGLSPIDHQSPSGTE